MRRFHNEFKEDFVFNLSSNQRRKNINTQYSQQVDIPVELPPSKPVPVPRTRTFADFDTEPDIDIDKTKQVSLGEISIKTSSSAPAPPPPPPTGTSSSPAPNRSGGVVNIDSWNEGEKRVLLDAAKYVSLPFGFEDIYLEFDSKFRIRSGTDSIKNENRYFQFKLGQIKYGSIISQGGGLGIGYPLDGVIEAEIGSIVVPNFLKTIINSEIYKRVYLTIEEFSDRQVYETSNSLSWADKQFIFDIKKFYDFDPELKKDILNEDYLLLEPIKRKITFKRPIDKVDVFTFVFTLGDEAITFEEDFLKGNLSLGPTTRSLVSLPKKHNLQKNDIIQFSDSRDENYVFQLYPDLRQHMVIDPTSTYGDFIIDPVSLNNYKQIFLTINRNFTISNTADDFTFNFRPSTLDRQYVIFDTEVDLNHTQVLERINELTNELDQTINQNSESEKLIEAKNIELDLNNTLLEDNNQNLSQNTEELHSIKNGFEVVYNITVEDDKFKISNVNFPLPLYKGNTYIFYQNDASNLDNLLRFSTTADGTNSGGTEYTTNLTVEGVPSTSSSKITFVIDNTLATGLKLYSYSSTTPGMGFEIEIKEVLISIAHSSLMSATDADTLGNTYQYYYNEIENLQNVVIPDQEKQINDINAQIALKESEKSDTLSALSIRKREKAFAQLSLDTMLYYKNQVEEKIEFNNNELASLKQKKYNLSTICASLRPNGEAYFTTTVSGGKFAINNISNPPLQLYINNTYYFFQNDASNNAFILKFYSLSNGGEWLTDVSFVGVPGTPGAYTRITITNSTPSDLEYYNNGTPNMGNTINISESYEEYISNSITQITGNKTSLSTSITDTELLINNLKNDVINIMNQTEFIFEVDDASTSLRILNNLRPALYLIRGLTYIFHNNSTDIMFKDITNAEYTTNITTIGDNVQVVIDGSTPVQLSYENRGFVNSGSSIYILEQDEIKGNLWLLNFFYSYFSELTEKSLLYDNQIEAHKIKMTESNNTFLWSEQFDDGAGSITTNKLASSIPPQNYTIYELMSELAFCFNRDTSFYYKYETEYDKYKNQPLRVSLLNGNGNADTGFKIDFDQTRLFDTLFAAFDRSFQNALTNDFMVYTPSTGGYIGHYENHEHIVKRPFQIGEQSLKEIICVVETNTGNTQQRINVICREYDASTNSYNQISNNNTITIGSSNMQRRIYLTKLNYSSGDSHQYFLLAYNETVQTHYNLCSIEMSSPFTIDVSHETKTYSDPSLYYLSDDIDLWHEGVDVKDADAIETSHNVIFFKRWQETIPPNLYKFQYVSLRIDSSLPSGTKIVPGESTAEYTDIIGVDAMDIMNVNGCVQMNEQTQLVFSVQYGSANDNNLFQIVEYHSNNSVNKLQLVRTTLCPGLSAFNSNNAFFPINNNLFVWVGRNFQIRNVVDVGPPNKVISLRIYNIQPTNINLEFETTTLFDITSGGFEHMLDTSAGSYLGDNLFFINHAHYESGKKYIKQILLEIDTLTYKVKINQTYTKTLADDKEAYYLLGYSNNYSSAYYTHPFTFYYYPAHSLYQWMVHHRLDAVHNNVIRMVTTSELIGDENTYTFTLDKRLLGQLANYTNLETISPLYEAQNSVWNLLYNHSDLETNRLNLNSTLYKINSIHFIDNSMKFYENTLQSAKYQAQELEIKLIELSTANTANTAQYMAHELEIYKLTEDETNINNLLTKLNANLTSYDNKIGVFDGTSGEYTTGYGYAYKQLKDEVQVLEDALSGIDFGGIEAILAGLYADLANIKNTYIETLGTRDMYKENLRNLLLVISRTNTSIYQSDAEDLLDFYLNIDKLEKSVQDSQSILADLNVANITLHQDLSNLRYTINENTSTISYKNDVLNDLLNSKMSEAIGKWVNGDQTDKSINRIYLQNITIPDVPFIISKRRFSIFLRLRVLVKGENTNYIPL